jgi:thiol-disulfide isomerase/thioredoxin
MRFIGEQNFSKMKKNLLIGLVMIAVLAGCQKEKPAEEKKKDKVVLNAKPTAHNNMPNFIATRLDGQQIVFKQLTGKVMIVFFNPGCDHCQREAQLISANRSVFSEYQLYFISPEEPLDIAKFAKDYNLFDYNMHFARGDVAQIINAVGPITSVPTIFIYDNQNLVKRLEGEISLEKLKSSLSSGSN